MPHILTINAGSSSVRFAIFSRGERPVRLLDGKMERVGGEAARERVALRHVAGAQEAQHVDGQDQAPVPAPAQHEWEKKKPSRPEPHPTS